VNVFALYFVYCEMFYLFLCSVWEAFFEQVAIC
jgi:hypothetical protein